MTQPFSGGGWVGDWSPGIGDPTFAGWLTAFAYLGAAALCFRNERRLRAASGDAGPTRTLPPLVYAVFGLWGRLARTPPATRLASLWRGLAVVMLGLGI